MSIARIRMIDFFNAEASQAFEEKYVKICRVIIAVGDELHNDEQVMKACFT